MDLIKTAMTDAFMDELRKIAAEIPMSFFSHGSPMAQKAKQVAGSVANAVKKAPPLPKSSVTTSAPPLSSLLKK